MDNREEKIRVRAYEIWEREGFMGDPEDHWFVTCKLAVQKPLNSTILTMLGGQHRLRS